jgi:hypothetical protein
MFAVLLIAYLAGFRPAVAADQALRTEAGLLPSMIRQQEVSASPVRSAPQQSGTDQSFGAVLARLAPHLAALLGMDRPRTYLLLVQNNHELRGTGGFIAAVGRITVDKGRVTDLDFADSYEFYSSDKTYPPPPPPLLKYMGIEMLLPRDANWSPDLPTAAQLFEFLYLRERGGAIDGIVTVDLNAVRHVVEGLEPLEVAGLADPITSANVEEQIIQLYDSPTEGGDVATDLGEWWSNRKNFIPAMAKSILQRVEDRDINLIAMVAAMQNALSDRSVQVWMKDPAIQSIFNQAGWGGALRPEQGADFLAVVDSNVGYNKVDAALQRGADYAVTWPDGADEAALATLTLTYTHPVDAEDPGCPAGTRYGASYEDMVERCYFDFVRVYVPGGSELVAAEGVVPDSIAVRRGERGTRVLTGYFTVEPRQSHQVRFTYRLPPDITPEAYRLIVQRQSGTGPLPLRLTAVGETAVTTLVEGMLDWRPAGVDN